MGMKDHPFGVVAELERTVVLAYAAPQEELARLIPSFLTLDTFKDQWGFIAVAIAHTRDLRPAGFPRWLGNDLWLVGYRIFVRYTNTKGRRLRGLYILGSETDQRKMAVLGNVFTRYRYGFKPMTTSLTADRTSVRSHDGSFSVVVTDHGSEVALPGTSVFTEWAEARRYVGPLPFTFSHDQRRNAVLVVEGARLDWHPRAVHVEEHAFAFLNQLGLSDLRLSNAFVIERVPYHWKKGELEPLA